MTNYHIIQKKKYLVLHRATTTQIQSNLEICVHIIAYDDKKEIIVAFIINFTDANDEILSWNCFMQIKMQYRPISGGKYWWWICDSSFYLWLQLEIDTNLSIFVCNTFIAEVKRSGWSCEQNNTLLPLCPCFDTIWCMTVSKYVWNKNKITDFMSCHTLNSFRMLSRRIFSGWTHQTRYHQMRHTYATFDSKRPFDWRLLSFNMKMQTQTSNVHTCDTQK